MAETPSVAEIEEGLVAELARILARDAAGIDRQAPLQQLGLDSLAFVALLVFIEKRHGLRLIDTPLGPQAFRSVSALAAAVRELVGPQS